MLKISFILSILAFLGVFVLAAIVDNEIKKLK